MAAAAKNKTLLALFKATTNGLFNGSYSILPTVHVLFNVSQSEAAHAFADEIVSVAKGDTEVRDSFEEELQAIFDLLRSIYWSGRSPAWYDRAVELCLHDTMQLVLASCNTEHTLRRACLLLIRLAEGLQHSTVARSSSGAVTVMLVVEAVTRSVVYDEQNGVKLDSAWAVFVEALAERILEESNGYVGGPLSKSTALGHACCSDPIRVLFQKVALNRNLLGDMESIHCACLTRLLSSLSRNASSAAARVRSNRVPLQSSKKLEWKTLSRGVLKQVNLKQTRLERKHWSTNLLLRTETGGKKPLSSLNAKTPPRSPVVATSPKSPVRMRLNL